MAKPRKTPLPASILVMGVPFTVEWDVALSDGDYGESNVFERRIRIGTSCDNAAKRATTLLHELIHAALGTAGHDQLLGDNAEEAIVVCLEHALMPLIKTILDVSNSNDPS